MVFGRESRTSVATTTAGGQERVSRRLCGGHASCCQSIFGLLFLFLDLSLRQSASTQRVSSLPLALALVILAVSTFLRSKRPSLTSLCL